MKVAFIVDSTGSLSEELLNHPDIYQVNLTVTFADGEVFTDTNDESKTRRFYNRMEESDTLPTTSQPEPGQYVILLDQLIQKKYDCAIFVHLSSQLSGTMQTAQLVAEEYKDQIHSYFVDSKGTSFVIENIVLQGQQLIKNGLPLGKVVEKLQWVANNSYIYVMIENLSNLVKGGRLSKGSAVLGNLLNVKPILIIDEKGKVEVFEKVRTTKRVYKRWLKLVEEAYEKYNGKIDIAFAHGEAEEDILSVKNQIQTKYPELNYRYGYLTPILGTHGGKGAKGIGIIPIVEA